MPREWHTAPSAIKSLAMYRHRPGHQSQDVSDSRRRLRASQPSLEFRHEALADNARRGVITVF